MKTIDVLCKKCNKWHFNLADNGWSEILCLNCRSEIQHPKRRPTKRAADSLKAGGKSAGKRVRKSKVISPAISG